MAINLKSCILACKHVIPIMREQKSGVIINISSMAVITHLPLRRLQGDQGGDGLLHRAARLPERAYGIRANVILPGLMNTPMAVDTRAREFNKTARRGRGRARRQGAAAQKMGTGWDVANAALFLASDEANFITGVTLPVDGGASVIRGG